MINRGRGGIVVTNCVIFNLSLSIINETGGIVHLPINVNAVVLILLRARVEQHKLEESFLSLLVQRQAGFFA